MFRNLEISTEKICDLNSNVNQTPVEPSEHDHQLSYDRVVWFKVLQRRRQKEQQSSQHVLMIIFNMRHFQTSCKMSTETFMQTVTDFCSTKMFFLQLGILIRASPAMTEQCCAHLDLTSFGPSKTIPVWCNATVNTELQAVLPFLDIPLECDVNALIFPCYQDCTNVISPSILNCADR